MNQLIDCSVHWVVQAKEGLNDQVKALEKTKEGLRSGLKASKAQLKTALQEVGGLQKQSQSVQSQLAEQVKECAQLKQQLADTLASNQRPARLACFSNQCTCVAVQNLQHDTVCYTM